MNDEYFIVQEYIEGGTLAIYFTNLKTDLYERDVCIVAEQILRALRYCHSQKVWHRDLKLENIMVVEGSGGRPLVKLIDFGLSREVDQKARTSMHATRLGTPQFQAPEVYQGKYSEMCDLWSLGIMLFLLITGDYPFKGKTNTEIYDNIMNHEFDFDDEAWEDVSDQMVDFIHRLIIEESQRNSAQECLQHDWIRTYTDQALQASDVRQQLSRLTVYQKQSQLVKFFRLLIASQQNDTKLWEQQKVFSQLDSNSDGMIEFKELLPFMDDKDRDELSNIIKQADADKNGKINYSEFNAATAKFDELSSKVLQSFFDKYDTNKDGVISFEEMEKHYPKDFVVQDWNQAVGEGGTLDFETFERIIRTNPC